MFHYYNKISMAEQYEYAKLTVDTVILKGLEADLANDNAVSKAYVDAHITTAINALVNGAVPALDTLKELGDALNNDANLASVLTSQISAVNTAITSEASARSTSDALTSNFENEKILRDGYRVSDRADAKQANDVEIFEGQSVDGVEWFDYCIEGCCSTR